MLYGNLTELLKKEQQAANYRLSEDEDFLYLWQGDKMLAIFNAHAACLDKVDKFIADREAGIVK